MPSFQVTSNELTAAGAIVAADDTDLSTGQSAMSGAGDSLSSGAKLGLHRSQGAWYITLISGGTPQQIKQGPCARAGS
jgi:hypothetical protein